jgi:maleylacetate reductase
VVHVPAGAVPDAAAAVRPHVHDPVVVALGGGRVIDAAKAVAAVDGLRCAAVPTTLSGAELTGGHRLPTGVERGSRVRPSLVLTDPALVASQPLPALAAGAANALAHATEALYAPLANPISELLAVRGARLLGAGLEPDEPDRDALALGALLAAVAMDQAGYAVHHVVCQSFVRRTGLPHAGVNAIVLPHVTRLMAGRAPRALALLDQALGGPGRPRRPRRGCGGSRLGPARPACATWRPGSPTRRGRSVRPPPTPPDARSSPACPTPRTPSGSRRSWTQRGETPGCAGARNSRRPRSRSGG